MAGKRTNALQAAKSNGSDDLTAIKGIGPAIAAHLQDTGILTFAQLAGLAPEEIAARVAGLSIKRIAHEKWIRQAQKLALKTKSVVTPRSGAHREAHQHYATFTIELLLGADNTVRRTRVTNVQTKSEEIWAGWLEPRLSSFIAKFAILEQLDPALSPELSTANGIVQLPESPAQSSHAIDIFAKECIAASKPKNLLRGVLKISNLVVKIVGTDTPQHALHANEACSVHIILDLTDVEVAPSTHLNCTVTIWAKKLGTRARQIVGEQKITFMPEEKFPCSIESKIPSEGTYRLEAMAALAPASISLSPQSTIRAWHEGGMFQVY